MGGLDARRFVLSNTIDTEASECTAGALLPLFVTDDVEDHSGEPSELAFSPATNGGTMQHVWIVDRDQWPLLIIGEVAPTRSEAELETIQAIVDSIVFH